MASTANFLKGHGWRAGAGYQPGEPNFGAIQGWNAATVYQQAIAIMGKQIEVTDPKRFSSTCKKARRPLVAGLSF